MKVYGVNGVKYRQSNGKMVEQVEHLSNALQIKPRSSLCFSATCAAAIAHRNYFCNNKISLLCLKEISD